MNVFRDTKLWMILESKRCEEGSEVGKYINTTMNELQIQSLEVGGQILSRNQLQVKLEDHHMKRIRKINQLKGVANDAFEKFIINTTRATSRIIESMFYINYIMHQTTDVSRDLEGKAKGLCSMKCVEIYDYVKLWDDLVIRKD